MADFRSTSDPILARVGAWAANLGIPDIPARVREKLRLQVASAVSAAAASPWHAPSKAVLRSLDGRGDRLVFATGDRRPAEQAAFANAAFAMALDFDDYMLSGHTSHSAVLVPLAYAATLDEVVVAAAAANELMGRLSTACLLGPVNGQMSSYIHNAGAALALGKVMGLGASELASAVALALYQPNHCLATGFWNEDAKTITASQPVAQGIRAAHLAQAGLHGPHDIVEHPLGFLSVFAFQPYPGMFDGLGDRWFSDTLCYKRYPGTSYISAAVEGALRCSSGRALRVDEVDAIEVRTTLLSSTLDSIGASAVERDPLDANAVNFSVRLSVATALLCGDLAPRMLDPESVRSMQDPIRELARKVTVVHDLAMTLDMMSASPLGLRMLAGLSPAAVVRSAAHARRLNRASGRAGRNRTSLRGVARRVPTLLGHMASRKVSAADFEPQTFRMLQSAEVRLRGRGERRSAFVPVPIGACGRDLEETRSVLRWRCNEAFGDHAGDVWRVIHTDGATVEALEEAASGS